MLAAIDYNNILWTANLRHKDLNSDLANLASYMCLQFIIRDFYYRLYHENILYLENKGSRKKAEYVHLYVYICSKYLYTVEEPGKAKNTALTRKQ